MMANSTVTADSLDSRGNTLEPPTSVPVGENRVLRSWRSKSDLADDAEGSAESAGSSHDVKGKANRRIWMLEEELASARAATKTQAEDFEFKLEREKESASRLQGTIEHLQGKVAKAEQENAALIKENRGCSEQVKLLQEQWGSQQERHSGQLEDLAGSVASLRAERSALNEQVTTLTEAKMALQEELRAVKARQDMAQSSRPALQVHSPNVKIAVRSPTPTTPTKPHLSTLDTLEAGKSLFSPGKSPTTSLARKFAHLEDRHAALREEYADLRSRYAADLKHWKEYRALEKARIELKTQKKADKRKQREERKLATQSGSTARFVLDTSTAKVLVAASDNSQSLPRARESVPTPSVPLGEQGEQLSPVKQPDNKEYYSDEEEDRHRSTSVDAPSVSEARAGPQVEDTGRHSKPVSVTTEVEVTKTYSRSETGYDGAASPSTSTPATGRQRTNVTNARTTPWLGTPSKPSTPLGRTPSVGHSYRLGSLGEEVFDATPLPDAPASPSGKRTPLVRDRGAQPGSSLRRSTLKKLVGAEGQLETPIKGGDTGRKRKSVEMDNLTPAEKALELRKLNKLSAKEKKEYYAQYKGKGRYTAPEELESHVLEEYEIDPEKNEGANYQFHDVKRHKMDRKQMHGGDCECCKDYYEAVGPIPQYNQGPKWKDAPQPNDQGRAVAQAEVREHQNKVSRHRETWRRNPTPPGFWEIGFPATQTVEAQNALADEMVAAREAQIRREAAHKDSKWRKKA